MNFSTHLSKLKSDLLLAFSYEKEELLLRLKTILLRSKELLITDYFDFWITQLNEIPLEEIPTTTEAVLEEKRLWENVSLNRSDFSSALAISAENLLSFSNEDDVCEMQSLFHYYYDKEHQDIFAESSLGMTKSTFEISKNIRIATISELQDKGILIPNTLLK